MSRISTLTMTMLEQLIHAAWHEAKVSGTLEEVKFVPTSDATVLR